MSIIAVVAVVICGVLWNIGGQGHKLVRALGVPIVIALAKLLITHNWWTLLYIPLLWGSIQAFSYGLNAPIHKFWVWVFKKGEDGNCNEVEYATRSTCCFLWSLPAILFAILSGSWGWFVAYSVILTFLGGYVGIVDDVVESEMGTGVLVGLAVFV